MEQRKHDNFDRFAKDYNQVFSESVDVSGGDRDYFSEYKIIEVSQKENVSAKLRVLDLGCGDGNSVKYFSKYFPQSEFVGTDVSEASIEEARAKMVPRASFVPYNGETLPFADDSFDVVFTSMVFHHVNFDLHGGLLTEIYRILKKGGRFYIFEHNPLNPVTRKIVRECEFDNDAVLLPHSYTNRMLRTAGFVDSKVNFTLFLPRHRIFRWMHWTERLMTWLPLGAQYFFRSVK